MRVLHVSAYFAPAFCYGGPPRSILGLCQSLRRHEIDAEVLTTTANGPLTLPAGRFPYEGVPVEYLPCSIPRRFFNAAGLRSRLAALLPAFDLLHIHGLWNLTVWKACSGARALKKPYVVSPRGMLDPGSMQSHALLKRVIYPLVERRNLVEAALLHATSQAEADALASYRLPPPICLVPNGVDFLDPDDESGRALRNRLHVAAADPVVMYLGRIAPLKRLDLLATAFSRVLERLPSAKLIIAGPNEDNSLIALRPLLDPLGAAVHILGELDAAGKRALFAAANVSVCCSDSESFGLSIAEALGAGVPAVITKTCPWPKLDETGAGRWVDQTPAAIAAALLDVLSNPPKAVAMGQRGRRFVRDEFSWDGLAPKMVRMYEEALAPGNPAR